MGASVSTGLSLYIGTTAVDPTTDTYTEVAEIVEVPEFGREYSKIEYNPIKLRGVQKFKGGYNDGSVLVSLGKNLSDAGQAAMLAASNSDSQYNFKIVANDAAPVVSAVATITIASPGVVSWNNHGLPAGTAVKFSTTGTLPTGLTAGTTYYVCSGATLLTNSFAVATSLSNALAGTAVNTSSTQTGTHTVTTVPAGSQQMLKALVMTFKTNYGQKDAVVMATSLLEIISGSIADTPRLP
jgi:hypothetical protein